MIIVNQGRLCEFFLISPDTLRSWKLKGMPTTYTRDARGRQVEAYDTDEITEWREKGGTANPRTAKEISATEKIQKFRALKAELEYKKMAEILVPQKDLEKFVRKALTEFKKLMREAPKRVAGDLVGLEATEIKIYLDNYFQELILKYEDCFKSK